MAARDVGDLRIYRNAPDPFSQKQERSLPVAAGLKILVTSIMGQITWLCMSSLSSSELVGLSDERLLPYIPSLTEAEARILTAEQLTFIADFGASFPSRLIGFLSENALGHLSGFRLTYYARSFSNSQIHAITPAQLPEFLNAASDVGLTWTASQMAALTTSAINGVSVGILARYAGLLSDEQIQALPPSTGIWLVREGLLPASTVTLTSSQISSLSGYELSSFVGAFNTAQIHGLTSGQVSGLVEYGFEWRANQIAALSTSGISGLSAVQLLPLSGSLTSEQLGSLAHPVWISLVKEGGIPATGVTLTTTDISGLSGYDLGRLWGALDATQMGALTSSQVAGITDYGVKWGADQIAALSTSAISSLSAVQLLPLAGSLSPEQLHSLPHSVLVSLAQEGVIPSEGVSYTTADISALSGAGLASIIDSFNTTQIQVLTSTQLAGVLDSGAKLRASLIAAVTTSAISGLSAFQLLPFAGSFTSTQLGALSHPVLISLAQEGVIPSESVTLTTQDIASLSGRDLVHLAGSFGTTQIRALTSSQLAGFSDYGLDLQGNQIAALSTAAINGLSAIQLSRYAGSLRSNQLNSLSHSVLIELVKGQILPGNVITLTTKEIAALSGYELGSFVGSFNTTQIRALTSSQLIGLAEYGADLQGSQIAALSASAISGTPAYPLSRYVVSFKPEQLFLLTPAKMEQLAEFGYNLPGLGETLGMLGTSIVRAFTTTEIENLCSAAVGGLSSAQIGVMSSRQLLALSTSALPGLTGSQLSLFGVSYVKALTSAQIASLSPDGVSGLTSKQIAVLSSQQIEILVHSALGGVSKDFLSLVPARTIRSLPPSEIAKISPASIAGLTSSQVAILSSAQVGVLSADSPEGGDVGQFRYLADKIAYLSNSAFQAITPSQLRALNANQLARLTTSEVRFLTTDHLASLLPETFAGVTSKQVSVLSSTQLNALNASVVNEYGETIPGQFVYLADKINFFNTSAVPGLTEPQLESLDHTRLQQIATSIIRALTDSQIAGFSVDLLSHLTSRQIGALASSQLAVLNESLIGALTSPQVSAISTSMLRLISNTQIAALSPDGVAGLTSTQVGWLTADQINALTPNTVDGPGQLSYLGDKVRYFDVAAISKLNTKTLRGIDVAQIEVFTPSQAHEFTVEHIQSWSLEDEAGYGVFHSYADKIKYFNTAAIAALSNEQIGVLTASQAGSLTTTAIRLLDSQIASLPSEAFERFSAQQVAALSSNQVSALSVALDNGDGGANPGQFYYLADKIGAFTTGALLGLTAAQLASLNDVQVHQIAPAGIRVLTSSQIVSFTPELFSGLSAKQIEVLSSSQIGALNEPLIGALTSHQLLAFSASMLRLIPGPSFGALSLDCIAALTPNQVAALTSTQVNGLSVAIDDGFGGKSPGQFPYIADKLIVSNRSVLPNLRGEQLGSLNSKQLAHFPEVAVKLLTVDQLAWITPQVISGFTANQVAALTSTQVNGLSVVIDDGFGGNSPGQFAYLADKLIASNRSVLPNLSGEQLGSLNSKQLAHFPESAVKLLTVDQLAWITPQVISGFTANQVAALTSTQVNGLRVVIDDGSGGPSPGQFAYLADKLIGYNPSAVSKLTGEQLGSLNSKQLAHFSEIALKNLTSTQFGSFSPQAMEGFTAKQVAALTSTQVNGLRVVIDDGYGGNSPGQFPYLVDKLIASNPKVLPNLTGEQLGSLNSKQLAHFTEVAVKLLAVDQLVRVSPEAISGFTANQVAVLTPAQVNALSVVVDNGSGVTSPGQFPYLADKVGAFNTSVLSKLTREQLGSLNATQVAHFPEAGLKLLTSTQFASITPQALAGLTTKQVSLLTPTQVNALSVAVDDGDAATNSGHFLYLADKVGAFNTSVLSKLTGEKLGSLNATQVAHFSETGLKLLTSTQFASLAPQAMEGLTTKQVSLLTSTQVNALSVAVDNGDGGTNPGHFPYLADKLIAFNTSVLSKLTGEKLGSLSATQIAHFPGAALKLLTDAQIKSFSPSAIRGLSSEGLASLNLAQRKLVKELRLKGLDAVDVAQMPIEDIQAFTSSDLATLSLAAFAGFTSTQIGVLDSTQVKGLSLTLDDGDGGRLPGAFHYLADKIEYFNQTVFKDLSAEQLESLDAGQVTKLTTIELRVLTSQQISGLVAGNIEALTVSQIGQLPSIQLELLSVLNPTQITALTTIAISAIDQVQVSGFPVDPIRSLTEAQIRAFTNPQMNAFSSNVLEAFTETQVAAFTSVQLAGLSILQYGALTSGNN
ncbi:MAG: hypothetical protein WCO60_01195 [Verrucomicrobiota bacterium]